MEEEQKERIKEMKGQGSDHFFQVTEKNSVFFSQLLEKKITPTSLFHLLYFNQIYQKFLQQVLNKPAKLLDLQLLYWQELYFLWQRFMLTQSQPQPQAEENETNDNPSQKERWHHHSSAVFVKDVYLMHVRHFQAMLSLAEGLDAKTAQQIQFYLKQILDVISPLNLATINPDVWETTFATRSENLLKGLDHALPVRIKKSPCVFGLYW